MFCIQAQFMAQFTHLTAGASLEKSWKVSTTAVCADDKAQKQVPKQEFQQKTDIQEGKGVHLGDSNSVLKNQVGRWSDVTANYMTKL